VGIFIKEEYIISQDIGTKQYNIYKTPERKERDIARNGTYTEHSDKRYDEIFRQLEKL